MRLTRLEQQDFIGEAWLYDYFNPETPDLDTENLDDFSDKEIAELYDQMMHSIKDMELGDDLSDAFKKARADWQ